MGGACSTEGLELRFRPVACGDDKKSREGHAVACVSGGRLVVFGGMEGDDAAVHVLGSDGTWSVAGRAGGRIGAAAAGFGDSAFFFGGVDPEQGCWLNELLEVNVATNTVTSIAPGLDGPLPRDKAALVCAGAFLVLFGGFGPVVDDPMAAGQDEDDLDEGDEDEEEEGMDPAKFSWFNDLHLYSIQNKTWRAAAIGNAPAPRAAHAMCLAGGRIWLYGGKTKEERASDLWSVAVADVLQNTPGAAWTHHELPRGIAPSGRSFHALVPLPNSNRLLLFGGCDNAEVRQSDVHVYDPELKAWAQPSFCENVPAEFSGAAVVRGDELVLHGLNGAFVSADLAPVRAAKIALPQAE